MPKHDLTHISDQELLLAVDGELSNRRAAQIRAHLEACWDCRARMAELEKAITVFARAHRTDLDPQLPPIDGPRALLRTQLAALASSQRAAGRGNGLRFFSRDWRTACIFAVLLVGVATGLFPLWHSSLRSTAISSDAGTIPDHALTPGATRPVTIRDVCSAPREDVIANVSISLREEVLREYGRTQAKPSDYEIDYLIAPGLGGAEDVRNLWPEPYDASVWNARVKDALEERLHEMVCSGQVDLSTAQHDIATDWIAAYRKYFRTPAPLSGG